MPAPDDEPVRSTTRISLDAEVPAPEPDAVLGALCRPVAVDVPAPEPEPVRLTVVTGGLNDAPNTTMPPADGVPAVNDIVGDGFVDVAK